MTTTETQDDTAMLAEAKRIADQIGLSFHQHLTGFYYLSWPYGHIWHKNGRPEPKGGTHYDTVAKIHKRICQYRDDFLFHRLSLSWDAGSSVLPLIEANLTASCCWKALLDNPHDEAALNGLKDWLDERGLRE